MSQNSALIGYQSGFIQISKRITVWSELCWGEVVFPPVPPPCFMGGRAGTDVTHMLPCDSWHC